MTRSGRLDVVCGPMFAGKTEELLRRVRRAEIAGLRIEVFSHALDTRRGIGAVSSHSGQRIASRSVGDAAEIEIVVAQQPDLDLVAIDEAHFFGPALLATASRLADSGLVVVVAGLDVTFDARPFEPLPSLMALADRVDALTAVCSTCGADAAFHQKSTSQKSAGDHNDAKGADARDMVSEHVGGTDIYQARCRRHVEQAWWRGADARLASEVTSSPSGRQSMPSLTEAGEIGEGLLYGNAAR